MSLARALFLVFALCWAPMTGAEVPVPPLTARVADLAGMLTAQQKAALEQTLLAFETRKGSQVAVLIVPTTEPETIEQYALRVAEQWKLGRKKVDDGAILAVAMKDRTLRIEVGYGLEGALTDAASKRIISEIITPRFRQGDFYGGIAAGVDQMIRVIDGEPLPEPRRGASVDLAGTEQFAPVFIMLALVIGGVLRALFGRFLGAAATGGAVALVAWLLVGALSVALLAGLVAFLFTLFGGGRGFGSLGGGLGGGSGGGGFSGGGGSFGGGGASGRW